MRASREVIVSHLVLAPPLVWIDAWRWTGMAQEHSLHPNQGFALIDGAGAVPTASVEIMRDTLVRSVAARDLTGTVQVRLGGQAAYAGNHNLFDSDLPLRISPRPLRIGATPNRFAGLSDVASAGFVPVPYPALSANGAGPGPRLSQRKIRYRHISVSSHDNSKRRN